MWTFTRSQIRKAGDALVLGNPDTNAIEALEFWRLIHFVPMNSVRQVLTDCIKNCELGCDAEVVLSNRLKRSESVIRKLRRYSSMDLSRMQDIAGIRLVLNITCFPDQGSRDLDRLFNHCFSVLSEHVCKVKDKLFYYTESPKESGYRAIHFVVEHRTDNDLFPVLPVEVQLRTKYQHLWAMAVETAEMFYNQPLLPCLQFFRHSASFA